jgi:hypothetical protein
MKKWALFIILLFNTTIAYPQDTLEINTILMRSTFMITGDGSTGTAFIVGKPLKEIKDRAYYVLTTAAHVLNGIKGDTAILFLRKRSGDSYTKFPYPIQIRRGTTPLWVQHPTMDVAVMYVSLPEGIDIELVPTSLLATDDMLKQFEIHPGDRLSCLGFPLAAEANDSGFPILRSGQIASFPLVPVKSVKTFLFDFNVFEGNSGGPVYFVDSNRQYAGGTHIGKVQFLMGLVSEQKFVEEQVQSLRQSRKERYQLGLGVVIPAEFIMETIDKLPETPQQTQVEPALRP